jgi:hypothetical protein
MTQFTRRNFLSSAALTLAATQLRAQPAPRAEASLTLPREATGAQMPVDFLGLSYEVQQLTDPHFFSAENSGLVNAFKQLAPKGVLRLGGNTSEFAYWKPTPSSPEPEHPKTREVEGEPKAQYYAVTAEAVDHLAGFLKVSGWTCIYGIGMGTNTPERAAAEAEYVAKTLGERLQYFQIGNEADLFDKHLRDPKTWSAATYLDEWLGLARAIAARVPSARLGMPDVAVDVSWLAHIADRWAGVANPPRVTTLSHHYYFGGPATNPDVNIPNLLKPATMAKVQRTADIATAAAQKMGVRVRMTEGNTCYRGGKPGVSNVFAAALWSADYALLLASNNYSGINLHGGTGKSVANSVGGVLPGDVMLKEQGLSASEIERYPHPFYTPIATFGGQYELQPVAYGLQFANALSGATLVANDLTAKLQAAGVNATAYAAKLPDGAMSLIVLNKDAERDLALTVDFGKGHTKRLEIATLNATALDSRTMHIAHAKGDLHNGRYRSMIPRASGIRLTAR